MLEVRRLKYDAKHIGNEIIYGYPPAKSSQHPTALDSLSELKPFVYYAKAARR